MLFYSDRYIFSRDVQFQDGRNIQLATGTGTRIGTATGQKLSFWNVTPVIQPAAAAQAAYELTSIVGADTVSQVGVNANLTDIRTLLNRLRTDLIAVGVIKGSA